MKYSEAVIQNIKQELDDTYIFQCVLNQQQIPSFLPGQYCYLANPTYKNPLEFHPFSIASSPLEKNYLEFCIKVYGSWTQTFCKKKQGDTFFLSENTGTFTWNKEIDRAVFLLGGIGISPIMSMLRFIAANKDKPSSLVMLYGNRTPETIAYEKELIQLQKIIPSFAVINIFSELSSPPSAKSYSGFITKEIIEKEVDQIHKQTFFIIGPPPFLQSMDNVLKDLSIDKKKIKTESIT